MFQRKKVIIMSVVTISPPKSCIYCGGSENGPLTKEHVLPSWLYEESTNLNIQLLQASPDKFISNQQTVKDVCAKCNNEVLSQLDTYAKTLYLKYFKKIVHKNQSFRFEYNYHMLVRWLLKVSYNSARANKGDVQSFIDFKEYILKGTNCPSGLTIMVQLLTPYYLNEKEKEKVKNLEIKDLGVIRPYFTRISKMHSPSSFQSVRMITLNSYVFYIFIPSEKNITTFSRQKELQRIMSTDITEGLQLLNPIKNKINVKSSQVSLLRFMEAHFMKYRETYSQLINK